MMKGTFKVGTRVQSEERRYKHTKLPVSPTMCVLQAIYVKVCVAV